MRLTPTAQRWSRLVAELDPCNLSAAVFAAQRWHQRVQVDLGVIAHQGIIEFVAAVSRPTRGGGPPLLATTDALRQAENLMNQFPVPYPTGEQLRLAIRGAATYALSWFDAQMWAAAELNGLTMLYSEDLQHGQVIGQVRIVNPFR